MKTTSWALFLAPWARLNGATSAVRRQARPTAHERERQLMAATSGAQKSSRLTQRRKGQPTPSLLRFLDPPQVDGVVEFIFPENGLRLVRLPVPHLVVVRDHARPRPQ